MDTDHDHDSPDGDSNTSKRLKPKRMSSIKKLGKFLGITSKKKPSDEGEVLEEVKSQQGEENKRGDYDLRSPIAKILNKTPPLQEQENQTEGRLSFRPKSFYRKSDQNIDDNTDASLTAPIPRKDINGTTATDIPGLQSETTNCDSTPTDPIVSTPNTPNPLIISTVINDDHSSDTSSFHSQNIPFDSDEDGRSLSNGITDTNATKTLRDTWRRMQVCVLCLRVYIYIHSYMYMSLSLYIYMYIILYVCIYICIIIINGYVYGYQCV